MRRRRLGRSGLHISEIGYGAWGIGGGWWVGASDEESCAALHRALELGVDFVDTALSYGQGHSEALVGRVLRERNQPIQIATKVPPKNMRWPALPGIGASEVYPPDWIISCCEKSLKNLGTETIDLLQLHVWLDEYLNQDDWRGALEQLARSGKVRFIGLSANNHEPSSALRAVASEIFDTVQINYNIFDQSARDELFPACVRHDVGLIVRSPLDEGGLTGTITPETTFPEGDFRSQYFGDDRKNQVHERAVALERLLGEEAQTLPELALRFCLSNDAVSTVIPGMRRVSTVEKNVSSSDGRRLSPALVERLVDHAWPRNFYPPATTRDARAPTETTPRADLPLSVAQEQVWLFQQLHPEVPHNFQSLLHFRGRLRVDALEAALTEIVRRHHAYRTSFHTIDGRAVQRVLPPRPYSLRVIDVADWRDESKALLRSSFDLAAPPLARWVLLRLSSEEHVFVHVAHALVHDGWSFALFSSELRALYAAFASGREPDLGPSGLQCTDHARLQREYLASPGAETDLRYWRAKLGGATPLLELPTDRPRPALRGYEGGAFRRALTLDAHPALRELGGGRRQTLFAATLSAFAASIHRLSGAVDFCLGSTFAHRQQRGAERVIGLLGDQVPLRFDLRENPTVRALFDQVRRVLDSEVEHRAVPFGTIAAAIPGARSTSYSPIIQVGFDFDDSPPPSLDFPGVQATLIEPTHNGLAKGDLRVTVRPRAALAGEERAAEVEHVDFIWEYSRDIFDEASVLRIADCFEVVLGALERNLETPVGRLAILPEGERHRTVVEWNRTKMEVGRSLLVHKLFEEQADRAPEATALIFEGQEMSFATLEARANKLAAHLSRLGVGRESLVGVLLDRSHDLPMAVLAVLKLGAAYIPLDAGYPRDRLVYMLQHARVRAVVTEQRALELLPAGPVVVCVDRDKDAIASREPTRLEVDVSPDDIVLGIYTSGSTGLPKLALNTHRGIANRLLWMQDKYRLTAEDRVLQKTPFSFDVSVWELFLPLISGATMVLARPHGQRDPAYMCQIIAETRVTMVHFIPSMLRLFLAAARAGECVSLKRVITGVEALTSEVKDAFFKLYPRTELFHGYGPSEAAIGVLMWQCVPGELRKKEPLGRPIGNVEVYLLDPWMQPIAIGMQGEIYIGGAALARGYFEQAGQTADRFLPDPFSGRPGARLYRTGDFARWVAGDTLEFLGRADQQVKVRGFRIETGEVEWALRQHPDVADAIVLVREVAPGDKRLIAYGVTQRPVAFAEVRSFLRTRLPGYMIPTAFVPMSALPLLPTGKVDRSSLPAPEIESEDRPSYVAPRTESEMLVAEIFAEMLAVERVGLEDDFFALGGDSLLLAQVLQRVRSASGADLFAAELFEASRVDAIAQLVDRARGPEATPRSRAVRVDTLGRNAVLDRTIEPVPNTAPYTPSRASRILLTGATGFLGAFLLDELARTTRAEIVCLARCSTEEEGNRRLRANLERYLLRRDDLGARVRVVSGDLARPLLGFDRATFEALAETIEIVVHAGSWVDLLRPYALLESTNVRGTHEVLRFSAARRTKAVHIISTVSALESDDRVVREDVPLDRSRALQSGYAQTKWVAEKLAAAACARGLPITIYRPGRVAGSSLTGVVSRTQFFACFLEGIVQLGLGPALDGPFDIVPIDYVSQAIAYLAEHVLPTGRAFHLVNPRPVTRLQLYGLLGEAGFRVEPAPYKEWMRFIERAGPANALHSFLPLLRERMTSPAPPQYDCRATVAALEPSSVRCPEINARFLARSVEYLTRTSLRSQG